MDMFVDDDGNLTASEVTLPSGRRLKIACDTGDAGPDALDERPYALLARREVERLHAACEEFLAR